MPGDPVQKDIFSIDSFILVFFLPMNGNRMGGGGRGGGRDMVLIMVVFSIDPLSLVFVRLEPERRRCCLLPTNGVHGGGGGGTFGMVKVNKEQDPQQHLEQPGI